MSRLLFVLAPLTILLDQPPATLNPRATLDAPGQRLNALIFRALTRIDRDLQPQPDLASRWEVRDGGKTWVFPIRPSVLDHAGHPITAEAMARCLENYRVGKPTSPLASAFPNWKATEHDGGSVVLRLDRPDPYLARNITLLRYFTWEGANGPCEEPAHGQPLIGSGPWQPQPWNSSPDEELNLVPAGTGKTVSGVREGPVRFVFVSDENAKALKLIRGEVDVAQNSLSLSKTRWLQREYASKFRVLEREGVTVGYLAFNVRDPILSKREVRRAIAEAIDRPSIVEHKLLRFCTPAQSFLSPFLPEAAPVPGFPAYDPADAERLLDQAGYPRGPDGTRFTLHYKTTPVREGIENAQMHQDMLRKIGIRVVLDVVEPAVFFASTRKGAYQLYSSRWIGVADSSIYFRALRSDNIRNTTGYGDPAMDHLLDELVAEPDLEARRALTRRVEARMTQDLPYFPLWFWKTSAIVRKDLQGLAPEELSLSGALEPLTHLR